MRRRWTSVLYADSSAPGARARTVESGHALGEAVYDGESVALCIGTAGVELAERPVTRYLDRECTACPPGIPTRFDRELPR